MFQADIFDKSLAWDNPKLSVSEKKRLFYSYYAGFSGDFVKQILDKLQLPARSLILDPWCGSGTTTFVSATNGFSGIGVDLNPVLTVISDARAASKEHVHIANEVYKFFKKLKAAWIDKITCQSDEDIISFFEALAYDFDNMNLCVSYGERTSVRALLLSAAFRSLRRIFSRSRASNPVWFRRQMAPGSSIDGSGAYSIFLEEFHYVLSTKLKYTSEIKVRPVHFCADFLTWKSGDRNFDAVITSPPYLTRIDYVMATYPESRLMARLSRVNLRDLRRTMLGTPITYGGDLELSEGIGDYINGLIEKIVAHPSKASGTYYKRFFVIYFNKLQQSIRKIAGMLRPGAPGAFVVQSSQYKDVFVDLALAIRECATMNKLELAGSWDFPVIRTIERVNTRSRIYEKAKAPVETLLIFRKA